MDTLTAEADTALATMTLDELAADDEAARIVARLTREGTGEDEPVRTAAFTSFI